MGHRSLILSILVGAQLVDAVGLGLLRLGAGRPVLCGHGCRSGGVRLHVNLDFYMELIDTVYSYSFSIFP
jgi:hypothetical protein